MKYQEAIEWLNAATRQEKIINAERNGGNPKKYINDAIRLAIGAMEQMIEREKEK